MRMLEAYGQRWQHMATPRFRTAARSSLVFGSCHINFARHSTWPCESEQRGDTEHPKHMAAISSTSKTGLRSLLRFQRPPEKFKCKHYDFDKTFLVQHRAHGSHSNFTIVTSSDCNVGPARHVMIANHMACEECPQEAC